MGSKIIFEIFQAAHTTLEPTPQQVEGSMT
jgi:hypothetical protein